MAARHAQDSIPTRTFKRKSSEPALAAAASPPPAQARRPFQPAEDVPAPAVNPATLETPDLQPAVAPQSLAAASAGLIDLDPVTPPDLSMATYTPASLRLPPQEDHAPESTLIVDPALPDSVAEEIPSPPASSRTTVASATEAAMSLISEASLPADPPPAREPAPEPAKKSAGSGSDSGVLEAGAGPDDLSERELAFVRSLATAAGTATSALGAPDSDLPETIPVAAKALLSKVPEKSVSAVRAAAAMAPAVLSLVKTEARQSARSLTPDLPLNSLSDLMPRTPDRIPENLPPLDAPASGKIDVQSDRQADYDQANNKVIFTGKVELNSAAIRLRADRVEVYMKPEGGMERVEARGNVIMRTQGTANGPGQMASAGRASYNLSTGEISLADWPKIQETGKSHISTDPSTTMVMFTDGRLRTNGPNRTIIGGN